MITESLTKSAVYVPPVGASDRNEEEARSYLATSTGDSHQHLPAHLAFLVALGDSQLELGAKLVQDLRVATENCPICRERIALQGDRMSGTGPGALTA